MSSERANILGRIKEGLRLTAQRPGSHSAHEVEPAPGPPAGPSDWLPLVGASFDERAELFRRNSVELKSDFRLTDGVDDWVPLLRTLAVNDGWTRVASHRGELTDRMATALGLPVLQVDDGYDARDLEKCEVGLTACDALVAQTGSVVVTSRSAGGRALSVLPPHHVVLARRDQLIADLPAAFALLTARYAPDYPSFTSLITGPSRTGDIERILVLGAHGPRKLTILCA